MPRKCPHCGATHADGVNRCTATGRPIGGDPELVGKLVAGRYHMVRLLGDGGMGAVYKAADQVLRRFVAIKMLHPTVAENPSSVERFEREARAAAAIGHPNIIDILDFGREGKRPYMVMEYLRGRSLSHVIAMDGPLEIRRATTIAIHTLAGLSAAHERGILHRDLKPANLMLVVRFGDRNFVKVCDFGFAALVGEGRHDSKSLTPERTLVGTPAYAAPERLRGDDRRDPRIDVYSLGVVLYEMLAGKRPFDAPTFRELARKVRKDPPKPLRQMRAEIPEELDRIVLRALAKEAADRWPSADEFAEALVPFGAVRMPFKDESPSDSFTMEMMRIKARETRHRETNTQDKIEKPPDQKYPKVELIPADGDETQRLSAEESLWMVQELQRLAAQRAADAAAAAAAAEQDVDIPIDVAPPISLSEQKLSEEKLRERPYMRGGAVIPTSQAPSSSHGFYNGRVVLAILRFVARQFGERALKDVLDSMPAESRRPFVEGIDADSWVALSAVRSLVEHIDMRLGQNDLHLVLETGRAAAEGAFDLMQELRPPAPPPELLIAEMPSILKKVVRGLDCEVRRVGRGYGRLELVESDEPSLTMAVGTLGFIARSLERFGADDVEVNLLSARALGDPQTLVDISWFA